MQEMLIDCVNEKVRRILELDPSKFAGGRMPFGLRPNVPGASDAQIAALEEEIRQLKDSLAFEREQKEGLKKQVEQLQEALERLKAQLREKPQPQIITREAPAAEQPVAVATAPSGGRKIEGISDDEFK